MRRYAYEGVVLGGDRVQGEIQAVSLADARRLMLNKGVAVRRLRSLGSERASPKLSTEALARITRQVAVMLGAGLPLFEALNLVAEGARKDDELRVLKALANDVSAGKSISDALSAHPRTFDSLYRGLVTAGEQSGAFDSMLMRVAEMLDRALALRGKIRKALVYPCIVVVVAALVMAVMLVFVVPMMESVFEGFGAELPAFTQFVLRASDALTRSWWWMLLFCALLIVGCKWVLAKIERIRRLAHGVLLAVPLVGKLLRESAMARLCETLATCFAAGMPLIDALEIIAPTAANLVLSSAILDVRDRVSIGELLHLAMQESGEFPSFLTQMVRIGEESGTLDTMLLRAARHYRDSVDEVADGLSEALGPVVMMLLAVIVGGLLVAMYLPIFSLGNALGG